MIGMFLKASVGGRNSSGVLFVRPVAGVEFKWSILMFPAGSFTGARRVPLKSSAREWHCGCVEREL